LSHLEHRGTAAPVMSVLFLVFGMVLLGSGTGGL
jgi:hypothetical protein